MGAALEQRFLYRHPSQMQGPRLVLSTASLGENPYFFEGRLLRPRRAAQLFRALMEVVHSRYHVPPAMLGRILAQADPVVTCHPLDSRSGQAALLRFEGFSACCGVYARIDMGPNFVDGPPRGRGTTNVDFSSELLGMLARAVSAEGTAGSLHLSVGQDQVALRDQSQEVIERQVRLPLRWLRSFSELPLILARQRPFLTVSGLVGARFLRSLPRGKHSSRTYLQRDLSISSRPGRDSIAVGGLHRLEIVENLLPEAKHLKVLSDPLTGATSWVLEEPDCRFTLALSAEVWRGFSGEGQLLGDLTRRTEALAQARARLHWQSRLENDFDPAAISALCTQGLVGFDLTEQAFFHRELPYDFEEVERWQPRLQAARQLWRGGAVRLVEGSTFEVQSNGAHYRVETGAEGTGSTCNCPWFSKHGESRGMCKHLLAVELFTFDQEQEP